MDSATPLTEGAPHLSRQAQIALNLSIDERLQLVFSDKFVLHPQARRILGILKLAIGKPLSERPASFLIVGASGTGKTSLIHRFYRDLGGDSATRFGASERMPIVVVEMPPRSTEPRVVLAIARSLRLPVVSERETRKVTDIILRKLKERGVRMVIFLEFDHLGTIAEQERQVVFHLLKNITNEGISVVGAGSQECVEYVLEDEQLTSRLRPLYLHGFPKDQSLADFVATLETFYPLPEASALWRDHLDLIFARTNGVAGEIVYLLNEAAAWSIRNGHSCIQLDAIVNCDYIERLAALSPSK